MTRTTLVERKPANLKVDALVIGVTQQDKKAVLADGHNLPRGAVKQIESALEVLQAKGAKEEFHKLAGVSDVAAPLVILAGLGTDPSDETVRQAAGKAVGMLTGLKSAAMCFPGDDATRAAAVAEGVLFGAYTFLDHRGEQAKNEAKDAVAEVQICIDKPKDKAAKDALERAAVLGEAVATARDLVNTAPNLLYPETFAQKVTAFAMGTSVDVTVMDEDDLREKKCGGILGVGQGSARGPRMVVLNYRPSNASQHVAIVGKGITFDSGGLSIKPANSMMTMKSDMAGAAATAAAVLAAAELGVNVAITAYLCLAENLTGANAQRPSDVVTCRNGKTVEVLNTDAEGRMVMADGLSLASEETPDVILDIATLTGAAVMALGDRVAAVLANNDDLRSEIVEVGTRVGEEFWPMPIHDYLKSTIESPVADLKNIGSGAGCLTAGAFLREFVGDRDGQQIPWAHLDIAGPAFVDSSPWGYYGKGGTGFGVRTLLGFVEGRANK